MPLFNDNDKTSGHEHEVTMLGEISDNQRTYCGHAITRGHLKHRSGETRPYTELFFQHHPTECKCPPEVTDEEKAGNLSIYFLDSEWDFFLMSVLTYYITEYNSLTPEEEAEYEREALAIEATEQQ